MDGKLEVFEIIGMMTSVSNKRKIANGILGNNFSASKITAQRAPLANILTSVTPNAVAQTSSIPSTSAMCFASNARTDTLNTFVSSQEIRIASSQVAHNHPINQNSQELNFMEMANRNLQGCNMYKCTIRQRSDPTIIIILTFG